jgi:predicted DNA-binding WGR domain protein
MTQTFSLPARIDMVAISDTENIRRHYRIIYSHDLFDQIIIDLHWGRIGTRGQSKQVSFAGQTEADKFVAQVLRRRASAKKRLGVAYQIL